MSRTKNISITDFKKIRQNNNVYNILRKEKWGQNIKPNVRSRRDDDGGMTFVMVIIVLLHSSLKSAKKCKKIREKLPI